jgi:hypothetical protein
MWNEMLALQAPLFETILARLVCVVVAIQASWTMRSAAQHGDDISEVDHAQPHRPGR